MGQKKYGRYNSKRERMKLKKALSKAEYLERQAVKIARNKAFEDEEAKKIPYEVRTRGARDQLSVSAVRRRGVQREGGGGDSCRSFAGQKQDCREWR